MLLDGGYIRQLNNVLMGFRRADRLLDRYDSTSFRSHSDVRDDGIETEEDEEEVEEAMTERQKKTQHIFVAATLPDYGLRSVDAYLNRKFPHAVSITMEGMHNARHYGLEDGSKTIWNEIDDNKDRMKRLVDLLKLDRGESGVDGRGLKGEKVMIFLNTVKDVDGATNGLRRAGIDAVPYHAKISLEDRTSNLDMFRRYRAPAAIADVDESEIVNINGKNTVPVLVCTDVASRGLDIPGVTAIVQLQFALNVVSHLHRMGRCGRAGNRDGRGIIFYGTKERELVDVVRDAEDQQSRMVLKQDVEDDESVDSVRLENEDGQEIQGVETTSGKVQKAFSRRRGFTKKRKNERRKALVEGAAADYD
jgi:superfamily II DNA/RNA helicase